MATTHVSLLALRQGVGAEIADVACSVEGLAGNRQEGSHQQGENQVRGRPARPHATCTNGVAGNRRHDAGTAWSLLSLLLTRVVRERRSSQSGARVVMWPPGDRQTDGAQVRLLQTDWVCPAVSGERWE